MEGEDTRRARIAANEAVFRTVNERIEELNRTLGPEVASSGQSDSMSVVCECGDVSCFERIRISIDVYEKVRSDSTLFVVVPGHEIPDVEDIVAEHGSFNVVCKHKGSGKTVAQATDPRS